MKVFSNKRFLLSIFFALLVILPFVLGANVLDQVFKPFAGTDFGATYKNYAPFIDAILYFWLFIALSKTILGQVPTFKDSAVPLVMGVILGIGMAVFEYTTKFNLGMLAPFAAIIFFLVFGIGIFAYGKKMGGNNLVMFSLAFIVVWSLVQFCSPQLVDEIGNMGMLSSVISVLFVLSIIGLIVGLVKLVKSVGSGEWARKKSDRDMVSAENSEKGMTRAEKNALKQEQQAQQNLFNLERDMNDLRNGLQQLENIETKYLNDDVLTRTQQFGLIRELDAALQGAWRAQQQVQAIYDKANQPGYSESKEVINQAAMTLDQYIRKLSDLLLKLQQSIKQTITADDQIKVNEDNFKTEYSKFEGDVNKLNDFRKSFEFVEKIDPAVYATLKNKTDSFDAEIKNMDTVQGGITASQGNVEQHNVLIRNIDERNLRDIDRCVSIIDTDAAQDTSKLYSGLLALGQKDDIRDDVKDSFDQGNRIGGKAGKALGSLQWAIEAAKSGYKYMSSSNLRQIYITIRDLYERMRTELWPLLENRNKEFGQKIKVAKDYSGKLGPEVLNNLKALLLGEVTKLKTDYRHDFEIFDQAIVNINKLYSKISNPAGQFLTNYNPGIKKGYIDQVIFDLNSLNNSPDIASMQTLSLQKILKDHILNLINLFTALDTAWSTVSDPAGAANFKNNSEKITLNDFKTKYVDKLNQHLADARTRDTDLQKLFTT